MASLEFNDSAATAALLRIQRGIEDLQPVMEDLADLMAESTRQRFLAGTAPDGTPWEPKSKTTLAAYEGRGESIDPRPLWHSNMLATESIFHQSTSDSALWGSSREYAAMMHFGGTKERFPNLWGDIPARPFLGVSETDRADIMETVAEWIDRLVEI